MALSASNRNGDILMPAGCEGIWVCWWADGCQATWERSFLPLALVLARSLQCHSARSGDLGQLLAGQFPGSGQHLSPCEPFVRPTRTATSLLLGPNKRDV